MNPKTLSSHFVAVAVGAIAALAISSRDPAAAEPALTRAGVVTFERRVDGCYCFINNLPDSLTHCRSAALGGGVSAETFAAAYAECSGK